MKSGNNSKATISQRCILCINVGVIASMASFSPRIAILSEHELFNGMIPNSLLHVIRGGLWLARLPLVVSQGSYIGLWKVHHVSHHQAFGHPAQPGTFTSSLHRDRNPCMFFFQAYTGQLPRNYFV